MAVGRSGGGLCSAAGLSGQQFAFWRGPLSWLFMILGLVAIVAVAVFGARFLAEKGPRFLNGFPPPALISLGFTLGGLIVVAGAVYAGLRVVGELASGL